MRLGRDSERRIGQAPYNPFDALGQGRVHLYLTKKRKNSKLTGKTSDCAYEFVI